MNETRRPDRELLGATILVTEPERRASTQIERLQAAGATVWHVPLIEIVPIDDPVIVARVDREIRACEGYDWLVFSSPRGVEFFLERVRSIRGGLACLRGMPVACIGETTRHCAEQLGLEVALVPPSFVAESLADALLERGVAGKRFLVPRALEGRDVLRRQLDDAGAERVSMLPVYAIRPAPPGRGDELRQALDSRPDFVTFTSSSTVRSFADMLSAACPSGGAQAIQSCSAVCIGPVTARTALRLGFQSPVVSDPHDARGIVDALVREWRTRTEESNG